ncbi:MAG: alpha-glucosidase [Solirubrobacteraceae bacterium]|jgi:glycosidase|nr:alpha-glucosidase [Solirubrobacteraceae bacterium]
MWWLNAVVYQIYPRSFQDSDGDGVGDLPGITARLEHVARLGADAIWLSPIHPSPLADFGYDVADYTAVDQTLGTLADFDGLVDAAHARGLRILMDLVPCHTSIEHPWFRAHPDWYIWADRGPPNNWVASFGGSAWSRDPGSGRWYLHSFFEEQPDLDWRNPEVAAAIGDVVAFWLDRGVDGFRVDALDRLLKDAALRDDPPARGAPPLPLHPELARLERTRSTDQPDVGRPLGALREAIGEHVMIGEVYLPTARLGPYLEHLDVAFSFELLHAPLEPARLREVITGALETGKAGWVVSNHDFPRLASRVGAEKVRVVSMLLLTLPGPVFIYQGDELGMADGPVGDPPLDRFGRDGARTPMQWEPTAGGGFTTGTPWLGLADPHDRNVADQEADGDSVLRLYRDLIALRRELPADLRFLETADTVLAYRRGDLVVALNLGDSPAPSPPHGEVLLWSDRRPVDEGSVLLPHTGWVARAN